MRVGASPGWVQPPRNGDEDLITSEMPRNCAEGVAQLPEAAGMPSSARLTTSPSLTTTEAAKK